MEPEAHPSTSTSMGTTPDPQPPTPSTEPLTTHRFFLLSRHLPCQPQNGYRDDGSIPVRNPHLGCLGIRGAFDFIGCLVCRNCRQGECSIQWRRHVWPRRFCRLFSDIYDLR